jgi:spoIIIJ-associated protein
MSNNSQKEKEKEALNLEEGNLIETMPQPEPLSDEEMDILADTATEALRGVLSYFGAASAEVDEYEGEDGELILDVVNSENLAVLIGHYGKTLDAVQFIVSAMVTKKLGYCYPIVVDVEGYRHRRRKKLEAIAKSAAARSLRSGSAVSMKPMTPYERRIVHVMLRDDPRVVTGSEGIEPNRYVVIRPAKR